MSLFGHVAHSVCGRIADPSEVVPAKMASSAPRES